MKPPHRMPHVHRAIISNAGKGVDRSLRLKVSLCVELTLPDAKSVVSLLLLLEMWNDFFSKDAD